MPSSQVSHPRVRRSRKSAPSTPVPSAVSGGTELPVSEPKMGPAPSRASSANSFQYLQSRSGSIVCSGGLSFGAFFGDLPDRIAKVRESPLHARPAARDVGEMGAVGFRVGEDVLAHSRQAIGFPFPVRIPLRLGDRHIEPAGRVFVSVAPVHVPFDGGEPVLDFLSRRDMAFVVLKRLDQGRPCLGRNVLDFPLVPGCARSGRRSPWNRMTERRFAGRLHGVRSSPGPTPRRPAARLVAPELAPLADLPGWGMAP